jgi:menaquinone-dependent protoporphyrinogen IX oxidase
VYCEEAGEVFEQFEDDYVDGDVRRCPFCDGALEMLDSHYHVASATENPDVIELDSDPEERVHAEEVDQVGDDAEASTSNDSGEDETPEERVLEEEAVVLEAPQSNDKQSEHDRDANVTSEAQVADRGAAGAETSGEQAGVPEFSKDYSLAQLTQVNTYLANAHKQQVWVDEVEKAPEMWTGDEDVPSFVEQWIDETMKQMDPVWNGNIDGAPPGANVTVQKEIQDSLTQPQGWSINSIASRLVDTYEWMEQDRAVKIVRQEVAAVLNKSREIALRAKADTGEEPLVRWAGPDDDDTTKICEEIKRRVDESGGAVQVTTLKEIIKDVATEYEDQGGTPGRAEELVPHFQCRHTLAEAAQEKRGPQVFDVL